MEETPSDIKTRREEFTVNIRKTHYNKQVKKMREKTRSKALRCIYSCDLSEYQKKEILVIIEYLHASQNDNPHFLELSQNEKHSQDKISKLNEYIKQNYSEALLKFIIEQKIYETLYIYLSLFNERNLDIMNNIISIYINLLSAGHYCPNNCFENNLLKVLKCTSKIFQVNRKNVLISNMTNFLHRLVSNRSYYHRDIIFDSEIFRDSENNYKKLRLEVPIIKELFSFIDKKVPKISIFINTTGDQCQIFYTIMKNGVYILITFIDWVIKNHAKVLEIEYFDRTIC